MLLLFRNILLTALYEIADLHFRCVARPNSHVSQIFEICVKGMDTLTLRNDAVEQTYPLALLHKNK